MKVTEKRHVDFLPFLKELIFLMFIEWSQNLQPILKLEGGSCSLIQRKRFLSRRGKKMEFTCETFIKISSFSQRHLQKKIISVTLRQMFLWLSQWIFNNFKQWFLHGRAWATLESTWNPYTAQVMVWGMVAKKYIFIKKEDNHLEVFLTENRMKNQCSC